MTSIPFPVLFNSLKNSKTFVKSQKYTKKSHYHLILCKISDYRERKRYRSSVEAKTLTAVYSNLLSHKQRKALLHPSLWHFRPYNRAVEQAGRLRGRLWHFKNAYISRTCAKLDKSGLITETTKDPKSLEGVDIATIVFIALATSEFSIRKVSFSHKHHNDVFIAIYIRIATTRRP